MLESLRRRIASLTRAPGPRVAVPVRYSLDLTGARPGRGATGWSYAPGHGPPARPRPARPASAGPAQPELRLGERLIARGVIDQGQLEEALMRQRLSGRRVGQELLVMRAIGERDLSEALAAQLRVPFVDLTDHVIDPAIAKLVPEHIAQRHQLIPINKVGNRLTVAMADPVNVLAIDDIQLMTGLEVVTVVSTPTAVQRALEGTFGAQSHLDRVFGDLEMDFRPDDDADASGELGVNDAPVIQLVNIIISQAVTMGASQIAIEPFELELRVRYRLDGVMRTEMTPPKRAQDAILQRIRVLAGIPVGRGGPQSGMIRVRVNNRRVDLRASLQPVRFGELAVLDVSPDRPRALDALGLEPVARRQLADALGRRGGLVLVAGPQHSGRTTTLTALLFQVNEVARQIAAVEHHPRLSMHGVHHVTCRHTGYARALAGVARLRPDVLVVGDVPDRRAAERIADAVDAGCLVIAKLSAPGAAAAIERVRALSRRLAAHLTLVSAQRLVRAVCADCRQEWAPPRHLLEELGVTPELVARAGVPGLDASAPRLVRGTGCDRCGRNGYRGQTGVFEVVPLGPRARRALSEGRDAADLCRDAVADGALPAHEAALRKMLQGVTALEAIHGLEHLPGAHASTFAEESAPELGAPFVPQDDAAPLEGPPQRIALVLRVGLEERWRQELHDGTNWIGVPDPLMRNLPDVDLAPHDRVGLIAPMHAQIILDRGQIWVIDELGSTGTQLNFAPLPKSRRTAARAGDRVTFANTVTLVLEAIAGAP